MGWRTVCITQQAKLELKLGYLVIRGEKTQRISLSEVDILIIETGQAALTTSLVLELVRRKVKLIFCDEKHNPSAEVTAFHGSVDSALRLREQLSWTSAQKMSLWTEIVQEKISRQSSLLKKHELVEASLLETYISQVVAGDASNREGHAAKVYFNALFGKGFSREQESATNAALNYGYSILLSTFNKEIVARGYLTQLGIYHDNQFNPYNLSSDLMETYRPLVDAYVKELAPESFEQEEKHHMLTLLDETVLIEEAQQRVTQAIDIYCSSVFRRLNAGADALLSHYKC